MDDSENAYDLIRVNREFDSNVIDESNRQNAKQFDSRISIFLPISTSDELQQ
jgi:hypothetical protein